MAGTSGAAPTRFGGGHGERAQLAGLDERQARSHDREGAIDAPGDHVGEGRRSAAIGHMGQIDLGQVLEQLPAHMRRAAMARRRKGDLAWVLLGFREKICRPSCNGEEFGTTRRLGKRQISVTGAKSATGS